MAEGMSFSFPSLLFHEGRTYGQPEVVPISLPQVAIITIILHLQTFVYLVLKFIFILVCSHYRNRTLSVLHNLRNSLVCTDKK